MICLMDMRSNDFPLCGLLGGDCGSTNSRVILEKARRQQQDMHVVLSSAQNRSVRD